MNDTGKQIETARATVMHVRCPDRLPEEIYRHVLELLAGLSPVVQALPPSAALIELKGALRYHGTDATHLGEMLRVRTISHLGVDVRIGIGPTITVAATASAQITHPAIAPEAGPPAVARPAVRAPHAPPAPAPPAAPVPRRPAVRAAVVSSVPPRRCPVAWRVRARPAVRARRRTSRARSRTSRTSWACRPAVLVRACCVLSG